ncbi:ssrA RNA (tmRNA)-binding protein [Deferribacter desulfuricans SSM1]|uniref:SsrA-binding protein n=1 Tax=Deferribacter desulfuricans (strain DSM 14783 / JCM 11476 / NBRC 101012 / SSM1) TaxID=639282 RepID=D3P9E4_DEFDS|nr:SsrA-binding protein SmpB [Deferribacter desulfuricans]BAI81334.1 ssrA RNA (tmRNA)-binding protein [Deferribacter desulfuricans SSM1]
MKVLATNKKAYHDYEILEKYEAGIVLKGTEVKSAKNGRINLRDSFIRISNGEAFLLNCHISPYEQGNIMNHDPTRTRKLLLHKREIERLAGKVQEKGLTLVPLRVYLKNNLVKVEVALAKGKKLHDKREAIKKKDLDREISRTLKNKYKIK